MADLLTSETEPPATPGRHARTAPGAEPPAPLWEPAPAPEGQFPTRMARRRALAATAITDEWQPAPEVTGPVLSRVQRELRVLPGDVLPARPGGADPSGSRAGRRAARADVRRRTRRRALASVAALAVVVAGVGAALVLHPGGAHRRAAPVAAPTATSTLLVLADGTTAQGASLLTGGVGSDDAQQVLLPSRLLLDVAGAGRVPLSQALATGAGSLAGAVSSALGVRVDRSVVLDRTALASLVDAVGGVTVDVDTDVTRQVAGGATQVLLSAGAGQRLNGAQAAAFALYLGAEEPEASRLARQQQVLDRLVGGLPGTPAGIRRLLAAVRPVPADLDRLAAQLAVLHAAAQDDQLASTVVPTRDIETGGAVTYYGLDDAAAATLVSTRLSAIRLATPAGGALQVLVQNGVGTPGLGETARARLVAAGYRFASGGNVEGFGQKQTVVVISDTTATSRQRGLAVARALGLGQSALRVGDAPPPGTDVVVVLGADFASARP